MILSIDQGTTGTTVFLFNTKGEIVSKSYNEFTQIFPKPSWVEHDPDEIWDITLKTIYSAIEFAKISASEISAIGITNQRETTVLWDKTTGKPLYNAIVWQCRRSSDICEKIKREDKSNWIHKKTGLVIDAYFSATKIKWLYDSVPEVKQASDKENLLFGTIDSWLIWKLTDGKKHLTDHTNASRTMLYNINKKSWDSELLDYFGIPESILPKIQNSASNFGVSTALKAEIPITGVAGDQQAALFGQQCFTKGDAKNTYGTGCFMLMYLGEEVFFSENGLLTTIACDPEGSPIYAFEGSVFVAGAAVQWLRDELQLISSAEETEKIAESITDTKGVYIVPAFTGLGAPYWDMNARGIISGLTRGSGRKEIIRATLESIAFQSKDVLELMQTESKITLNSLRVDGGACKNNFLMQFQSDMLGIQVDRPKFVESTAIGAGLLAGIGAGIWSTKSIPDKIKELDMSFRSHMTETDRKANYSGWKSAVQKTKDN